MFSVLDVTIQFAHGCYECFATVITVIVLLFCYVLSVHKDALAQRRPRLRSIHSHLAEPDAMPRNASWKVFFIYIANQGSVLFFNS